MGSSGKQRSKGSTFKAKAQSRVDDLQGVFCDLQAARKENRPSDVAFLEEQVNQMLREWKAELHEPSPSSSLLVPSPASSELSSDMKKLLQLIEEDDDASSPAACAISQSEQQPYDRLLDTRNSQQDFIQNKAELHDDAVLARLISSDIVLAESPLFSNEEDLTVQAQVNSPQLLFNEALSDPGMPSTSLCPILDESSSLFFKPQSKTFPPLSAFLGPKCALWDCPRPAHGSDWYQDYCSNFHASLAGSEGAPGMRPVVRPRGIDLKDGLLFAALVARSQSKAVGIPDCEGAATSKSPWNATELFDTSMLSSETVREWLFFDKPRRAFESGTRKQRSLPDYTGRGWHESRKQVLKDIGGLKRSYYMDPQPNIKFEWHLYEYELDNCDDWALYKLELKEVNNNRKSSKAKGQNDQVTVLEKQIDRLSADLSIHDGKVWDVSLAEAKGNSKCRTKSSHRSGNQSSNLVASQTSSVVDDIYVEDTSSAYMLDVNDYLSMP